MHYRLMSKDSDSTRLRKAGRKWRHLKAHAEFSAPLEERLVGIIVAIPDVDEFERSNDEQEFFSEAEELLERSRSEGFRAEVHIGETRDGVAAFIGDRAITDLVFIGHGHLSRLRLGDDNNFNWFHLSRSLNHLKQGFVIQRFCGGAWDNVSIALGTFAVSDMRRIQAPVNQGFDPVSLDDVAAQNSLTQVYNKEYLAFDELLRFSSTVVEQTKKLHPPQLPDG